MPHQGSTVFLRLPSQSKTPILHPSIVISAESISDFAVQPEDLTLPLEAGMSLMIYFEFGGKFVQQPATIEALPADGAEPGISIKTTGDWVSAENRQTYRICTVMSNLDATINGEVGCPVHDVSVTGFAVVASGSYTIGQVLDAELPYQDKTYKGKVSIQSVREVTGGKFRYGVNCIKEEASPTSLTRGVRDISMAEQRQRLNRLARSA